MIAPVVCDAGFTINTINSSSMSLTILLTKMFTLNYVEVFVRHNIVTIFGLNTKQKVHFLSFKLQTIMCIVKYLASSDEAILVNVLVG